MQDKRMTRETRSIFRDSIFRPSASAWKTFHIEANGSVIGNVSFQTADKVIWGMWWMSEMSFLLVSFLKCAGLNWFNFWTELQMKRFSYVRFSLRLQSVDFSMVQCKRPCFYVPPRVLTHRFSLHYSSFDQLFIFFTEKNVTIRFNSF